MSKLEFKPTPEQEDIQREVRQGADSLMVTAFAGCAKTSTLTLAAHEVKVPGLALAFNKRIATELQARLPGNFTCKTLNGLGFGAWTRSMPGVQVKLDDKKLGKLVTQVAKDRKIQLSSEMWDQIRTLTSKAMQEGMSPGNEGEPLREDLPEEWAGLADDLWVLQEDQPGVIDMAREVLGQNNALARQGIVSFDDQVYCPTILGGRWPQYPVAFIDEAQDLSPLQHRMLTLATRADARLLVVGDPKQAIYAFRGADGRSMSKLRGLRQRWADRPLATTFRCPKAIVARQQEHVPGFRAWHTNPEGQFNQLRAPEREEEMDGEWTWSFADIQGLLPTPNASTAVLCRNNAPLMSMAFKLLRRGIGINMLGRDLGKGLIALTRRIAPDDGTPADQFLGKLEEWEQSETSKAMANKQEERVAGIQDRAECLRASLTGASARDAGELRRVLERLFARESGQVTLGSIHRAKGLEWDVVLHLDPWRIPSKQARMAAKSGDPIPLEQEWNLNYVAETRAKWGLINASLEDFQ